MNNAIFIMGLFLSSFVSIRIIMELLNNLFERKFINKKLFYLLEVFSIALLGSINALSNEWFNLITVITISCVLAIKLFEGNIYRKLIYIIILVICMSACESIGILILHFVYQISGITIASEKLRVFFDITTTQVFVIFISHIVILRIMKKKNINNLNNKQYFLTFVYAIFSIITIYSLSVLMRDIVSGSDIVFVLITIFGTVVINTYFLNILEYASENNRLQYENQLFIQQSRMQYQYYDNLENQYRESLSIIHDVKRHIRAIEDLYNYKESDMAKEYSKKLSTRLEAFQVNEYTDDRVLNIILNDKIRLAEQNNIQFSCKIDEFDLSFIDNVDLTTIFANLLDNAIEACLEVKGERSVSVQVGSFNNLVVISIKNTMDEPMPGNSSFSEGYKKQSIPKKSSKKGHSGIGIPNVMKVINKYNGDFNIQREGTLFVCSIVLSKQGRQEREDL